MQRWDTQMLMVISYNQLKTINKQKFEEKKKEKNSSVLVKTFAHTVYPMTNLRLKIRIDSI